MIMDSEIKNVTIQQAINEDYAQWIPLWKSYQEFYGVDIPEPVTRLNWGRFLDAGEPMFCAVAKVDDHIIGFVHYLFHRSTWAATNYCYLEDLFVRPDVRGKQVGKQLIDYVRQQAHAHEASRLYWHTHQTNLRGQRLYDWVAKKSGMIEYQMPM